MNIKIVIIIIILLSEIYVSEKNKLISVTAGR